jgi:RNA polymerase primary sigma factor
VNDRPGPAGDNEAAETGGPNPADLSGEAPEHGLSEVLFTGDDDDGLPAARLKGAGASADPVKDYLQKIGRVPLLSAAQEVELAKRIEAGLFAEEKLAVDGGGLGTDQRADLEWVAEDGAWWSRWPDGIPATGCCSWT